VVGDVDPVAGVAPGAVDGQRAVGERVADEERELLLGVLVGAVVVRAARDDDGQAIGSPVREGEAGLSPRRVRRA
jgi:hypothetical protein